MEGKSADYIWAVGTRESAEEGPFIW